MGVIALLANNPAGSPGPQGPPGVGSPGPVGAPGAGVGIVNGGLSPNFIANPSYMTSPYEAPAAAACSLMIWLHMPTAWSQPDPRFIYTTDPQSNSQGIAIGAGINLSNGPVQALITTATGGTTAINDPGGTNPDPGSWVLFVAVYNGSNFTLYRNGVSVVSTALAGGDVVAAAAQPFTVGGGTEAPNSQANAPMAHAAYWSGVALTATQVADLYSNALAVGATEAAYEAFVESLAPTVYFPMQETSGTTATNHGSTGSVDNGTYTSVSLANQGGPVVGQTVVSSDPPATTTAAITSGTAYQNTATYDVILRVPVTYSPTGSAAATLAVGIGPTAAPTQITEDSEPATVTAGTVRTKVIYLPRQWYVLLTATNATLGTATVQPV